MRKCQITFVISVSSIIEKQHKSSFPQSYFRWKWSKINWPQWLFMRLIKQHITICDLRNSAVCGFQLLVPSLRVSHEYARNMMEHWYNIPIKWPLGRHASDSYHWWSCAEMLVSKSDDRSSNYLWYFIEWHENKYASSSQQAWMIARPRIMMTSSNGNISALLALSSGTGEFHVRRASDAELWCFLWVAPGGLRRHRAHFDVIVKIITVATIGHALIFYECAM